ncbi:hypothetical protein BCR42DRAFT_401748 [Absidia repens]|uniref:Uncharacterized protein n=1 Tax=Absidia repens TaxID=90262 RepID=A0A1X2J2Z7_9FUNG|nr:hypothetical protein BCR42DRAFT_401748 [Absidia repens]
MINSPPRLVMVVIVKKNLGWGIFGQKQENVILITHDFVGHIDKQDNNNQLVLVLVVHIHYIILIDEPFLLVFIAHPLKKNVLPWPQVIKIHQGPVAHLHYYRHPHHLL